MTRAIGAPRSGALLGVLIGALVAGTTLAIPSAYAKEQPRQSEPSSKRVLHDLSGRVVLNTGGTLYVDQLGAVVPVQVAQYTKLEGLKSAADLKEGDGVRIVFSVEQGIANVAVRMWRDTSGTGGSGDYQSQPAPENSIRDVGDKSRDLVPENPQERGPAAPMPDEPGTHSGSESY